VEPLHEERRMDEREKLRKPRLIDIRPSFRSATLCLTLSLSLSAAKLMRAKCAQSFPGVFRSDRACPLDRAEMGALRPGSMKAKRGPELSSRTCPDIWSTRRPLSSWRRS
jgi:hypothetical protein